MKNKPDEALSKLLIDNIEKSKLIDKRFLEKLKKGFTQGNLSGEDWELFVEEVPTKEKSDGK